MLLRSPVETWKLPLAQGAISSEAILDDTIRCVCGTEALMKTVKRKGISIDVCPDCGGVWFDGGELEELVTKLDTKEGAVGIREAAMNFIAETIDRLLIRG